MNKFKVGDSVILLDGPEESSKIGKDYSLWNERCMRSFVGLTGVVDRITGSRGRKEYVVIFHEKFEGRDNWYCYEEWLSATPMLTESYELNAMFEEIGGST